jgi:hypothetical protein
MRTRLFISFLVFLALVSCKPTAKQDVAFYYWKSVLSLDSEERSALIDNQCKTLYLKYFDIVKEEGIIKPIAVISFNNDLPKQRIVPVLFIRNEVFAGADSLQIEQLAKKTISLIDQINFSNSITVEELQWDCDWTEKTRNQYFQFLRSIKRLFRNTISATIRLHQIKYKAITGIPPVDKGVLMYYNMNSVSASEKNSIYDKSTANKYLNSLRDYPLQMDIALPVFIWGIHSREGKIIGLLNKMNEGHFTNDTNFVHLASGFSVRHACFKGGYYFREEDKIKIEYIKAEDLLQMAEDIKPNLSSWPSEIIFYDLDSLNLSRYDKNIFKSVLDRFN